MLWIVHHLWTSGARFIFSCYHHWSSLVLKNGNGTARFLNIREGVTQGYPLAMLTAMVAYGIGVLPLIKQLKAEYPDITYPCYADDTGSLGTFVNAELYFNLLKRFGPGRGYYPKP